MSGSDDQIIARATLPAPDPNGVVELAIASGAGGYFLFYLGEDGVSIFDDWLETFEQAKSVAADKHGDALVWSSV